MLSSPVRPRPRLSEASGAETVRHLTGDQLSRLAEILHAQLDELHERISRSEDLFQTLSDDPSVDASERQALRQVVEQAVHVLRETDRAMSALDDGTYGSCAVCGRAIPFERLEALPTTQTCVACPGP